uniref:Uncharacterized protein n=1 Tax=Archangium disciforme TaxID=38 RepID=B3CK81_9BACT|nr:hypothetical protein [Archangium disciforme]
MTSPPPPSRAVAAQSARPRPHPPIARAPCGRSIQGRSDWRTRERSWGQPTNAGTRWQSASFHSHRSRTGFHPEPQGGVRRRAVARQARREGRDMGGFDVILDVQGNSSEVVKTYLRRRLKRWPGMRVHLNGRKGFRELFDGLKSPGVLPPRLPREGSVLLVRDEEMFQHLDRTGGRLMKDGEAALSVYFSRTKRRNPPTTWSVTVVTPEHPLRDSFSRSAIREVMEAARLIRAPASTRSGAKRGGRKSSRAQLVMVVGRGSRTLVSRRNPTELLSTYLREVVSQWPRAQVLVYDASLQEVFRSDRRVQVPPGAYPAEGSIVVLRDAAMKRKWLRKGDAVWSGGEDQLALYYRPYRPRGACAITAVTPGSPEDEPFSRWAIETLETVARAKVLRP